MKPGKPAGSREEAEAERPSAAAPAPTTASNATAQPPSVPDDVREFLEAAGLKTFVGSFAANGYNEHAACNPWPGP